MIFQNNKYKQNGVFMTLTVAIAVKHLLNIYWEISTELWARATFRTKNYFKDLLAGAASMIYVFCTKLYFV